MRNSILSLLSLFFLNFSWIACGSSSSQGGAKAVPVVSGEAGAPIASKNGLYWVSLSWSSDLKAGTLANSAVVKFSDASGESIAAELGGFKLFMPSMGHGSIKTKDMILAKDPDQQGTWNVSNIYFSMGGSVNEWVVDITATVAGVSDTVRVAIPYEVGE